MLKYWPFLQSEQHLSICVIHALQLVDSHLTAALIIFM